MILSALVNKVRTLTGNVRTMPVAMRESDDRTPPYIVIDLDSTGRERHYGSGNYVTAFEYFDFEIQVFGKTQSAAISLAQTVKSGLENFVGLLQSVESPVNTYTVHDIEVTSEFVDYETTHKLFYYSIFITVTTRG